MTISFEQFNQTQEKPSENKAKHERAYWVELTRKELGTNQDGDEYTFGQINGLTSNWKLSKLRDRYNYCKKHANCSFPKAWWGIRKRDKQKQA